MSGSWKRVFGSESNRPPARAGVLVSGEMPATEFVNEINSWERIARSIEKLAEALTPKAINEPAQPKWLSPAEAAKAMRVNVQTVMKWCRAGRLEASKVSGKWLIPQKAIDAEVHRLKVIGGK